MVVRIRFSATLDEHEYAELAAVAEEHRVSMAWLVRYAVTEFLNGYRSEVAHLPLRLAATRPERRNA